MRKLLSLCRSRYSYYSRSIPRMRDLRDYQYLPNIILRCFGINHCFWGVIILILGFVELGITANDIGDYWNPTPNRWKTYAYYAPVTIIFTAILVRYQCNNFIQWRIQEFTGVGSANPKGGVNLFFQNCMEIKKVTKPLPSIRQGKEIHLKLSHII